MLRDEAVTKGNVPQVRFHLHEAPESDSQRQKGKWWMPDQQGEWGVKQTITMQFQSFGVWGCGKVSHHRPIWTKNLQQSPISASGLYLPSAGISYIY